MEIFESDGCNENIEDCERARSFFEDKLNKFLTQNNFIERDDLKNTFLSENGRFAVYSKFKKPQFNIHKIYKNMPIYEGIITLLVKCQDHFYGFDINTIRETHNVFNHFNDIIEEYNIWEDGDNIYLIIEGEQIGTIIRSNVDNNFKLEKQLNVSKIKYYTDFFGINEEDGLIILETEEFKFDWNKLDANEFVLLCRDILISFPQTETAMIVDGVGDLGEDIIAIEVINGIFSVSKKKWSIQCKHFTNRKVAPSDISDIILNYSQLKFDGYCLMTSNFILPSTRKALNSWENDFKFNIKIWDRSNIEDFLKIKKAIYFKYFK